MIYINARICISLVSAAAATQRANYMSLRGSRDLNLRSSLEAQIKGSQGLHLSHNSWCGDAWKGRI